MTPTARRPADSDEPLAGHEFDGIQEYDKRLPNWWLWTLYGAVAFSFFYWFYFHWIGNPESAPERLQRRLAQIALAAATSGGAPLDDAALWKMTRDNAIVTSGRKTFLTQCVSCHGVELKGGIGPNLTDKDWIHGGRPSELINTITTGVLAKGMPAWGPVLGRARIAEVASYIMSHHTEGEEIRIVPSTAPTLAPGAALPAAPPAPAQP